MFCQNCGKEIQENAEFCVSCGANIKQGKPVSQEFANKVKTASQDALSAFKVFAVNPVGGLSVAFESLDRNRALWVGVFFAVVSVVSDILTYLILRKKLGFLLYLGGSSSGNILKLILLGAIPFVSIAVSSALARKIFRGAGSFEGDIFIAGASLLPLAFFQIIAGILGIANFEVITILAIFAICYTILMLYSGSTQISKITEGGAALAVPVMLLLSIWLIKIIYSALW